jgi:hypothetical protein
MKDANVDDSFDGYASITKTINGDELIGYMTVGSHSITQ